MCANEICLKCAWHVVKREKVSWYSSRHQGGKEVTADLVSNSPRETKVVRTPRRDWDFSSFIKHKFNHVGCPKSSPQHRKNELPPV